MVPSLTEAEDIFPPSEEEFLERYAEFNQKLYEDTMQITTCTETEEVHVLPTLTGTIEKAKNQ